MTAETDHNSEARDWLKSAEDTRIILDATGTVDALVAQRDALIGIGHALLALTEELRGQANR